MSRIIATYTDSDGTVWPLTGYVCQGCGLPLWRTDGYDGPHPGCEDAYARVMRSRLQHPSGTQMHSRKEM